MTKIAQVASSWVVNCKERFSHDIADPVTGSTSILLEIMGKTNTSNDANIVQHAKFNKQGENVRAKTDALGLRF